MLFDARVPSLRSYAVVGWRSWGARVGLLRFFNSSRACVVAPVAGAVACAADVGFHALAYVAAPGDAFALPNASSFALFCVACAVGCCVLRHGWHALQRLITKRCELKPETCLLPRSKRCAARSRPCRKRSELQNKLWTCCSKSGLRPVFCLPARRRGVGMSDLAARLQLRKFEIARVSLSCILMSGVSGAHARFLSRRRPLPRQRLRKRTRVRAVVRRAVPFPRDQPLDIMQSLLFLCLAFCVFSPCSGSSLRVDRHGFTRESNADNAAFMMINGKSGAQEMCLVVAGGTRFVYVRARPGAACGVA